MLQIAWPLVRAVHVVLYLHQRLVRLQFGELLIDVLNTTLQSVLLPH